MTKEQLALRIASAIHTSRGKVESFHALQCIKNYFLDLEMQDLIGIAGQYGISIEADYID
tara:strand:- start:392 stop:571 length:180 start_codon:yes stop_codon:yes gene_type:complete